MVVAGCCWGAGELCWGAGALPRGAEKLCLGACDETGKGPWTLGHAMGVACVSTMDRTGTATQPGGEAGGACWGACWGGVAGRGRGRVGGLETALRTRLLVVEGGASVGRWGWKGKAALAARGMGEMEATSMS